MKEYYYFQISSLPKHGWLQNCYLCGIITSNTYKYNFKSIGSHYFHICPGCKSKYKRLYNNSYDYFLQDSIKYYLHKDYHYDSI